MDPAKVKDLAKAYIASITNPQDISIFMDGSIQDGKVGAACILPTLSARIRIHVPASTTQMELIVINMALIQTTPPDTSHMDIQGNEGADILAKVATVVI